mmetsp:Transcript_31435/g.65955  ORF Transcript_31435/g.65955 Transcript_31435/m.65955 type:complete len:353 (-) Transcript_31435:933-1991(-)
MALPDDHHRGVGDRLRSGLRGLRGDGRIGIPPFLEHGLRGSPPEGPGGDRGTGVGNDTRRPRRPGPPPRRRDGRRLCQRAGVGRLDGNGPGQQVARGRGPADRSRQRQGPPRLRLSEPLPEAPPGGGRPRALRRRVPRARRLQRHRGRSRHGRERMAADGEVLAARLPRADPGVSERTKPSDRRALVRARIQRCRHETKQNKTEQNRTERNGFGCVVVPATAMVSRVCAATTTTTVRFRLLLLLLLAFCWHEPNPKPRPTRWWCLPTMQYAIVAHCPVPKAPSPCGRVENECHATRVPPATGFSCVVPPDCKPKKEPLSLERALERDSSAYDSSSTSSGSYYATARPSLHWY